MPGPESLRRVQYYGYPRNQFWRLISAVTGEPAPKEYRMRLAWLKELGISLWDTIAACERQGALDSAIREAQPNDIAGLLTSHPSIRAVFANGRKAQSMLTRYHPNLQRPVFYLPSSSNGHAAMNILQKVQAWQRLCEYLN
jgi:TDG/mug DNA glycosylase family protein